MSSTGHEITADIVAERLSQLAFEERTETTPAEVGYRKAAAVLASFVPGELRPIGTPPDDKALDALLRVCEPVYASSGRLEWRLPDALRRETLESSLDNEDVQLAATANASAGGPVQRMLSAYVT